MLWELFFPGARQENPIIFLSLGLLSLLGALYILQGIQLKNPQEETKQPAFLKKSLWFKLSLFISLSMASYILLSLLLRVGLTDLTAKEYMRFILANENSTTWMRIIFPLIILLLAYFCLKKKGIVKALSYGAYSLFAAAIIFIFMLYIQKDQLNFFFLFESFISVAQSTLIVLILHIFYLTIGRSYRPKAKVLTEIFFALPVLHILKSIPTWSLFLSHKSLKELSFFLSMFPIAFMLILVFVARSFKKEN